MEFRSGLVVLKAVMQEFLRERSLFHGAALGYYALLAMVPTLYLSISFFGRLVGHEVMLEVISDFFQEQIGVKNPAELLSFMDQIDLSNQNPLFEILGLLALVFSTTTMLGSLRRSMNEFYNLDSWKVSRKRIIVRGVLFRIMSVGFITGGVLLFVLLYFTETIFLSVGYNLFEHDTWIADLWSFIARHGLPVVTNSMMFVFVFKYVHDGKVAWKRAIEGAMVTGALMYLGQLLIHFYVQNYFFAGKGSMLAGTLLVILVWVYYSSQIIFLGAKFIAVRSRLKGTPIRLRD